MWAKWKFTRLKMGIDKYLCIALTGSCFYEEHGAKFIQALEYCILKFDKIKTDSKTKRNKPGGERHIPYDLT